MTMRMGFTVSCLVAVFIMLICVSKVKQREETIGRTVEKILKIEIIAALASILAVSVHNYLIAALGYGICYLHIVWLCYYMVQYTCEYTKLKTRFLWVDDLWKILLMIDSVSLVLNAFWGHMAVWELRGEGADFFWVIQPKPLYYVHLGLCFCMVIESIIRLVMALVSSPVLYRFKYLSVLAKLLIVSAAYLFFFCMKDMPDASTPFFAVGAIVLVYSTFYFVPRVLRRKMLTMVFREMEDSLVMFDDKGNCVYVNNKWSQNDVVNGMKKAEFDIAINAAHDADGTIQVCYGDEKHCYEHRCDELRDDQGKYIGCYYIFRDITVERELLLKQQYLAHHDVLTGVYNRNYFFERSEEFMKKMPEESFLIVCSDIRKFKVVNEIFGIQMGDKVLKLVADSLTEYSAGKGVYGRVGADSFALCIPEKQFDVECYVEKTNEAIRTLDIKYPIINHIGIYRVEDRSLTVSAMCDRALLAVNSIKSDYQREIVYYNEGLREQLLQEQEILKDLQQAFEENQFVIYLQPQFSHSAHRIIGAEVLVRWIHPVKGIISPNVFVPLLEKVGLITKVNVHVWELACKQLQKWKNEGKSDMSVSVNISTKDFCYIDIYDVLTELVRKYNISVDNLKLEITESAFTMDLVKQLAVIEKLQAEGFVIEMDDFGSGYSSLNSLKDLPVDVLKMDMAFMSKSDRYKRSADILRAIVAMARKLNMPVIAEGVETKEQADFLGEIGCNIIQGYYYAKPMPVAQFEEMLSQYNEKKI